VGGSWEGFPPPFVGTLAGGGFPSPRHSPSSGPRIKGDLGMGPLAGPVLDPTPVLLLSVMVTGPSRKYVLARKQFWTGCWPISNEEGGPATIDACGYRARVPDTPVTVLLLSVMVTGPLSKHVLVRKHVWTGFWPISNGEGLKIGLRLASGRPGTDFEIFPIGIRPKIGPTLHSLLKHDFLRVRPPSMLVGTVPDSRTLPGPCYCCRLWCPDS
jgi:hypothetical protein